MELSNTQQQAVKRLYENDETLLIAGCGVGKTVIALTAISELIAGGELSRVLVVAPAKVVSGWVDEALKWPHLNLSVIGGTGRASVEYMLTTDSTVIVTSYDSVKALLVRDARFDGVVFDEITRLKESGGTAFRAIRGKLKATWRLGLSATPLSEDWMAVYGMTMMLDGGQRFGRRKDRFIDAYFYVNPYQKYDIKLRVGADKLIVERMSDLVWVMDEVYTHPEIIDLLLDGLPPELEELQKNLAQESYAIVKDKDVVVANAAVLSGKFRQIAQGFVHDENGDPVMLWGGRFDALKRILKGSTVVAYEFSQCGKLFREQYPDADVIDGSTSKREFEDIMQRWRRGWGKLLFLQVQSGSHGLDGLQNSAHRLVFFAPIWSNDKTIQMIGRLARTGQKKRVEVTTLVMPGTIDQMIVERVNNKKQIFKDFLRRLK